MGLQKYSKAMYLQAISQSFGSKKQEFLCSLWQKYYTVLTLNMDVQKLLSYSDTACLLEKHSFFSVAYIRECSINIW